MYESTIHKLVWTAFSMVVLVAILVSLTAPLRQPNLPPENPQLKEVIERLERLESKVQLMIEPWQPIPQRKQPNGA